MARVYNQLPSAIPTANDGVRMNDENHLFLKSKKVNLKLKRMWLCHATIIRGLDILLVTRGENIICQVKKKDEYA